MIRPGARSRRPAIWSTRRAPSRFRRAIRPHGSRCMPARQRPSPKVQGYRGRRRAERLPRPRMGRKSRPSDRLRHGARLRRPIEPTVKTKEPDRWRTPSRAKAPERTTALRFGRVAAAQSVTALSSSFERREPRASSEVVAHHSRSPNGRCAGRAANGSAAGACGQSCPNHRRRSPPRGRRDRRSSPDACPRTGSRRLAGDPTACG